MLDKLSMPEKFILINLMTTLPKDGDSNAKILKQLLANEGHFGIAITDKNKVIQATFDTTGLNESYQDLLKHRR